MVPAVIIVRYDAAALVLSPLAASCGAGTPGTPLGDLAVDRTGAVVTRFVFMVVGVAKFAVVHSLGDHSACAVLDASAAASHRTGSPFRPQRQLTIDGAWEDVARLLVLGAWAILATLRSNALNGSGADLGARGATQLRALAPFRPVRHLTVDRAQGSVARIDVDERRAKRASVGRRIKDAAVAKRGATAARHRAIAPV